MCVLGCTVHEVIANPPIGTTKFFPTGDGTIVHLHMGARNFVGVTDGVVLIVTFLSSDYPPFISHPLYKKVQTASSVSNTHSAPFTEESRNQIKYLEV